MGSKSRYTERWMLGSSAKVQHVLTMLYGNTSDVIKDLAVSLVDYLTKLGFENYRHILTNPSPASTDQLPQSAIIEH